jgi:histidinol-phosphatase (PHP family)
LQIEKFCSIVINKNGDKVFFVTQGMEFMFDYHMHTQYSGDIPAGKGSTVAELCEAAIKRGLQEIAITDHCDIDGIYYGAFPKLDIEGVFRDIQAAREQFAGKLNILFGIEIGQACHMPKESKLLIDRFGFDYVIGSVHAVRGILDFADLKINELSDSECLCSGSNIFGEMKELLDWGLFSTLAHITYPYRYTIRGREHSA